MAISRSQIPESVKNPSLYRKAKSKAKAKFDVYPSAYANAYMVTEYKKMGGEYEGSKKAKGGAVNFVKGGTVMAQGRGCGAMMESKRRKTKMPRS
jgi:hypothetical protein|tara:strand:+ start:1030 stop:1314 length:285 start_codon:yes stop_codon:yes gene_type:complete